MIVIFSVLPIILPCLTLFSTSVSSETGGKGKHRKPPAEHGGRRRGQCRSEQGACARCREPRRAADPGGDEHTRAERETGKPRRRALRLLLFLFAPGDRPGLGRIAARAAERHGLDDGRREILRAVIENAVVR